MLKLGENTYITADQANRLLREHPDAARWAALDDDQKENCLALAARRLEKLRFAGKKHRLFQALAFPRDSACAPPAFIQQAQALEALALAEEIYPRKQDGGPVSQGQSPFQKESGPRSQAAAKLLAPYLL